MSVRVDLLILHFDKPEQQPQAMLITMRFPFEQFAPFVFHQTGFTTNFVVLELPSKPLLENNYEQNAGYLQQRQQQQQQQDSMEDDLMQADGVEIYDFTNPNEHDDAPFLSLVNESGDFPFALQEDFVAVLNAAQEAIGVQPPEMCREGEGATYFMKDVKGKIVGVFKPDDGDPLSDSNPKRKARLQQRRNNESDADMSTSEESGSDDAITADHTAYQRPIPKGGAAIREVAAYALDKGFSGVPPTAMVRARSASFGGAAEAEAEARENAEEEKERQKITAETKQGSFQYYVDHECGSWDVPSYKFSVADVHRIGVLDLRILNTDRHGGNMLVVAKEDPRHKYDDEEYTEGEDGGEDERDCEYKLVPIDHGYAFPTTLSDANFEWLYWPQARKPFSRDTLNRIAAIDPDEDAAILRSLGLCEEAVRVNRVCTTLLKKGAAAGLTLAELGRLVYRRRRDEPSALEAACEEAGRREQQGEGSFFGLLGEAIAALVEKKQMLK